MYELELRITSVQGYVQASEKWVTPGDDAQSSCLHKSPPSRGMSMPMRYGHMGEQGDFRLFNVPVPRGRVGVASPPPQQKTWGK